MTGRTSLKTAFILLLALVAAMLVFAGCVVWKYRSVMRENPPVTVLSEPAADIGGTEREIGLGTPLVVSAEFRVPWNLSPGTVSVEASEGVQLASGPVFEFESFGWGANRWRVFLTLLTYRDGVIAPGVLKVNFIGSADSSMTFDLPQIKSVLPEVKDSDVPRAAGELEPPAERPLWFRIAGIAVGLVILLLAALAVKDIFFGKKTPLPVPFWTEMLDEIGRLRESVKNGDSAPEFSIGVLTHIVRRYLEVRFSIRAERQTTSEFLAELEKDESPLSDNDRRFLQKFLVAADMVKYARISSDTETFEAAAGRAEKLIRGTAPATEDGEKGKEPENASL